MKSFRFGLVAAMLALISSVALAQGAPAKSVRISGAVMAAQILNKVQPVYPEAAKTQGVQGAVVIHVIIGTDGTVENLAVVSGPEGLQKAAIDAVTQWTYKPFLLNGRPVQVDTTVTVTFSLTS